ncbi:LAFA_0E20076g1_1 [Lachancea sp. 'fantastica']|nr:LAFA_0E20076g1_1 [Lachancea sp. 'fantastica']
MEEKRDSIHALALNCAKRHLPPAQFVNFYNELVNELYGSIINRSEDAKSDIDVDVYEELSICLLRVLESQPSMLLSDYVNEVLFVNYNTELAHKMFPQLYTIKDLSVLAVLLSKASAFFLDLNDKLLIDQICDDLSDLIIPCIFAVDFGAQSNQIVLSVAKFVRNISHISTNPILVTEISTKDKIDNFMSQLSKTNKLLYRKLHHDFESLFKIEGVSAIKNECSPNGLASPSAVSPKYKGIPLASTRSSLHAVTTSSKFRNGKLVRYCKNLWLNNKILNWSTNARDFVSDYGAIEANVLADGLTGSTSVEKIMTDLIETSFTSFAQFVSNKQYHQPNFNLNLLERQWAIFITKQLPLHIMECIPKAPDAVITALENVDHKVIKVLKSYASDKDDAKSGGSDLFEEVPNKNMDIRHEFLKNLILLGCQPPSVLNDYLREDHVVDTKSLLSNDTVVIRNTQGVKESISDFPRFIKEKINELDVESMFSIVEDPMNSNDSDIVQVLRKFDTLAATKQRELSEVFHEVFCESARNFDCKTVSKICCLMCFNLSHSLTTILTFIAPARFVAVAAEFVDETWDTYMKQSNGANDDFEPNTEFVCFTYCLILIINITRVYGVPFVGSIPSNFQLSSKSFTVKFLSDLGTIAPQLDLFSMENSNVTLENWVRDLFVNGSLSDSLIKFADAKDITKLIPFIFKQSILGVEVGAIRDVSTLTGGFEYFLQPFLIVGLIGIVFWSDYYLTGLKSKNGSKELLDPIFEMFSSLLNPSTLNEEARPLHTLILRLNAVPLLKATRAFLNQSASNYGIYSSDSAGGPKLESLISHLERTCSTANLYNIDSGSLSSENGYPRKELPLSSFSITAEHSINGILHNQINSFWNMHSSTYYNLDYLFAFIDIMTPFSFFEATLSSLRSKTFESTRSSNRFKSTDGESSAPLDYFFHFLVTHDLRRVSDKNELLNYMTSSQESGPSVGKPVIEQNSHTKVEQHSDEDFDMLFGEDTSAPGNETDVAMNDAKTNDKAASRASLFLGPSFAIVLCDLLSDKGALLKLTSSAKEEYEELKFLHEKYVEILRSDAV